MFSIQRRRLDLGAFMGEVWDSSLRFVQATCFWRFHLDWIFVAAAVRAEQRLLELNSGNATASFLFHFVETVDRL